MSPLVTTPLPVTSPSIERTEHELGGPAGGPLPAPRRPLQATVTQAVLLGVRFTVSVEPLIETLLHVPLVITTSCPQLTPPSAASIGQLKVTTTRGVPAV